MIRSCLRRHPADVDVEDNDDDMATEVQTNFVHSQNFTMLNLYRDAYIYIYINTDDNHSDAQTKPLPYGEKRVKFCKKDLKHIYGHDEHVKNAVTDVIEQKEHEMPAAATTLWMYNFVGTTT